METKANNVVKAIMPIIAKVITTFATTLCDNFNKVINTLSAENDKLAKRIEQMNEEHSQAIADKEQRIAELTDALAKAGKGGATPAPAPKAEDKPKAKKDGSKKDLIKHFEYESVLEDVKDGTNVYLWGPAGTGKTEMCEMIADELGLDFYSSAKLNDEMGIVGYQDGHGRFHETPFYHAMKFGGLFLFDELDASNPNAVLAVNQALSNGYCVFDNGEMVKAHKDFRIIASGNTTGRGGDEQYTGRYVLDASTLDRFFTQFISYDERIELHVAKGDRDAVQFVHDLRKAMDKCNVHPFTVSYRGLSELVKKAQKKGVAKAVEGAIVKGLDQDNVNIIYENMIYKSNKYAIAFHKSANAYSNVA